MCVSTSSSAAERMQYAQKDSQGGSAGRVTCLGHPVSVLAVHGPDGAVSSLPVDLHSWQAWQSSKLVDLASCVAPEQTAVAQAASQACGHPPSAGQKDTPSQLASRAA